MVQMLLPITLMTTGGTGIIAFWLAMRTGAARRASGVSIGDGGNEPLIRRMRAQANFVENAPFILILIGLIEMTAGTSLWLWIAGSVFLLARIAHALGMDDGFYLGRMVGTMATFLLLVSLSIYALVLPFTSAAVPAAKTESVFRTG